MELIKRITKDDWTLEHSKYQDDFGILRDSFEMIKTKGDGSKIHYPFLGPIKVRDNDNILDASNDYTDEEYQNIFEANIK